MTAPTQSNPPGSPRGDLHYRNLLKSTLRHLLLLYFLPVVLLAVFFHVQHRGLITDTRHAHLQSIAEHQAYTLDLFLRERVVNLKNVIDDPRLPHPPGDADLARKLADLRKTSDTFVDLGWFDAAGDPLAYAGPYPDLETRNYGGESWFRDLRGADDQVVITDIYMGFREQPHFTIAVAKEIDGRFVALRAVLSPDRIREYLATLQQDDGSVTSLLGEDGQIQVLAGREAMPLAQYAITPPGEPWLGSGEATVDGERVVYAWAWLTTTPWVLLVEGRDPTTPAALISGGYATIIAIIGAILVLELLVIVHRARQVVAMQRRADEQEAELSGQLAHAAKLATVGELAAGIAHEINNPLAIIAEETGLIKDLNDPRFGDGLGPDELNKHLDTIHDAAFRARDITRKLLGFVRQDKVSLGEHDVRGILDQVVDGMMGRELQLANVKVVKDYSPHLPSLITDQHQLQQVFLNLVKNALDAMEGEGTLTVHAAATNSHVTVSVHDTGVGMSHAQIEKIFMPFFTTKEVGKGTGLGLSVSYGIIQGLEGRIHVESEPGKGSMFTVELPIRWAGSALWSREQKEEA